MRTKTTEMRGQGRGHAAWAVVALAAVGLALLDVPGGLAQGAKPEVVSIRQARAMRPMRGVPPVAVQGYYHNDQVPVLLESLDLLRINTVMPRDRYLVLRGKLPAAVKEGGRVEVTGAPVAANMRSATERREGTVFQVDSARVLEPPAAAPEAAARRGALRGGQAPRRPAGSSSNVFSLLLVGGADPANNHKRYWSDLGLAYHLLRDGAGCPADNIYVLYADGKGRDSDVPVDAAATADNLRAACADMGKRMNGQSTLLVIVSDHGGGFLYPAVGEMQPGMYGGSYDANDRDPDDQVSESKVKVDVDSDGKMDSVVGVHQTVILWGESMPDSQFAAAFDQIPSSAGQLFVFGECFSGGLHYNMRRSGRAVISASGANEFSFSRRQGDYDEFLYEFCSAMRGQYPDGTEIKAGSNSDPTLADIWNWAVKHDDAPEHPFLSVNGGAPVSGPLEGNSMRILPPPGGTRGAARTTGKQMRATAPR